MKQTESVLCPRYKEVENENESELSP
jgi:hypothetical protein